MTHRACCGHEMPDQGLEVETVEQLHHVVQPAVFGDTEVVELHRVRRRERGGGARLALEAHHEKLGITRRSSRRLLADELDRRRPDQQPVARARLRPSRPHRSAPRAGTAPARSADQEPKGGLTAAGRERYRRTEGAHLKPGVKKKQRDMTPAEMRRKGSWAVAILRPEDAAAIHDGGREADPLRAHGRGVGRTDAQDHGGGAADRRQGSAIARGVSADAEARQVIPPGFLDASGGRPTQPPCASPARTPAPAR